MYRAASCTHLTDTLTSGFASTSFLFLEKMEKQEEKKRLRFSIRIKTIIIIVIFGVILAEIAMVYFSLTSSNNNQKKYKEDATELSDTVALSIDVDEVKALRDDIISIYDSYEDKPTRDKEGTPEYEEYMAKVAAGLNMARSNLLEYPCFLQSRLQEFRHPQDLRQNFR